MPLPAKRRKTNSSERWDQHPYVIKLNIKLYKLSTLMNQIYDLADSNLVLTDARTGLNDFSMNEAFAKKLDEVSKSVLSMSKMIQDKAESIREKIEKAVDTKENLREIYFDGEVLDWSKKSDEARRQNKITRFKRSVDYRIKHETLDSDSEAEAETAVTTGEMDGKFTYRKQNENPEECHNFSCEECCSVFRDENELRNHDSNHKMEFYHCLQCMKIFRSMRSFENHNKTHSNNYTCDICHKTFLLKTSLTNHKQVHSSDRMHCTYDKCTKVFKHRQNQLEHIQWGHRDKKECPCTVCGKLFQTPTNMRGHRIKQHGHVEDIVPGHPGVCKRTHAPTVKIPSNYQPASTSKKNSSKNG